MQDATIDAVIDRMTEIDATLPSHDGVACFNQMYLRVTVAVRDAAAATTFENRAFLEQLDIAFAQRFFAAFDADLRGEEVHAAWAPLFSQRNRPRTMPIQFALAGMNAHINYDLPVSVVSTCAALGLEPRSGTAEHRDFTRVNEVLDQVDEVIRREFDQGIAGTIDHAAGHVDDTMEMWCISGARGVAWDVAETLWSLQDHEHPQQLFLRALGRSVALASHGILI